SDSLRAVRERACVTARLEKSRLNPAKPVQSWRASAARLRLRPYIQWEPPGRGIGAVLANRPLTKASSRAQSWLRLRGPIGSSGAILEARPTGDRGAFPTVRGEKPERSAPSAGRSRCKTSA